MRYVDPATLTSGPLIPPLLDRLTGGGRVSRAVEEIAYLECREDGAHKAYRLVLVRVDLEVTSPLFVVAGQYGPIGNLSQEHAKTPGAVPQSVAQKAFYATLGEKLAKGYLPTGTFEIRASSELLRRFVKRVAAKRPDAVAPFVATLTPEQAQSLRADDIVPLLMSATDASRLAALRVLGYVQAPAGP